LDSPSSSQKPSSDLSNVIPAAPTFVPVAPVYIPEAPFAMAPSPRNNSAPQQQQYQPPPQPQHQQMAPSYPSSSPIPPPFNNNMSSRPVASNADSKVKDAIEYASFAITALKVGDQIMSLFRYNHSLSWIIFARGVIN
jgi:hypothetical protein